MSPSALATKAGEALLSARALHFSSRFVCTLPFPQKGFAMHNTPWFTRQSSHVLLGLLGLAVILFTLLAASPFHMSQEKTQGGLDPGS
jgi:hypothetical protein